MRRSYGLAVLAIGFALLTGCTSSGGDPGIASVSGPADGTNAPSAAPGTGTPTNDLLGFTRCMRGHGIDIPDADPNAGVTSLIPALQEARQAEGATKVMTAVRACQQYLAGVTAARDSGELKDEMFTYFDCLRAHGADVDDPDPVTGRPSTRDIKELGSPDATMQQAMDACADKRPGALAGGN